MKERYKAIIQTDLKDRPNDHELSAVLILINYFKSNIIFLRPQTDKTPDVEINGSRWEIKSPIGDGKEQMKKLKDMCGTELNQACLFLFNYQTFLFN